MKWTPVIALTLLVGLVTACAAPADPLPVTPASATPDTPPAPAGETPQPEPPSRPPAIGTEVSPQEPVGEWTPPPAPGKQTNPVGPVLGTGEQQLVSQARADLSERLGVAPDQIELMAFDAVTWPDGSLGCPQPGMAYTQVLVDGARIVLAYNGQTYEYHSGGRRAPFWCENPQ
jgi:hypothetical protein